MWGSKLALWFAEGPIVYLHSVDTSCNSYCSKLIFPVMYKFVRIWNKFVAALKYLAVITVVQSRRETNPGLRDQEE